jgi:hypothetical protein
MHPPDQVPDRASFSVAGLSSSVPAVRVDIRPVLALRQGALALLRDAVPCIPLAPLRAVPRVVVPALASVPAAPAGAPASASAPAWVVLQAD